MVDSITHSRFASKRVGTELLADVLARKAEVLATKARAHDLSALSRRVAQRDKVILVLMSLASIHCCPESVHAELGRRLGRRARNGAPRGLALRSRSSASRRGRWIATRLRTADTSLHDGAREVLSRSQQPWDAVRAGYAEVGIAALYGDGSYSVGRVILSK
jgi:hypothetical protein